MNSLDDAQKPDFALFENVNLLIMSLAYLGLFFSGFIFPNPFYILVVGILGWIVWLFGLVLAFSPIIVFRRRGGIPKGSSFFHTTKLVNDGIYGLVRHPQYTGGMVIAFSICLIVQTPVSFIVAFIAIVTTYLAMVFEEQRLIVKFGSQYEAYKALVPRSNLLLGLLRHLRKSS